MLWIKAFHLISMVTWFAGLFYLPRLFVYHTEISPNDSQHYKRFCIMEKKLFWIIMTPGGILTLFFGTWLIQRLGYAYFVHSPWLHLKISLVFLLVFYHVYLFKQLLCFKKQINQHSARFYRMINEFPSIILFAVVLLAVLKPKFG